MTLPSTHPVQTPFDSVENAQAYIQLLLGTLAEARKEIMADTASAASSRLNAAWRRCAWWNTSYTGWSTT